MYRLLIVEDETPIRLGIRDMIDWTSLGIRICGLADDGMEAITLAQQTNPDILLTDVRMPLMNGLEVISHLHTLDIHPISIVLTGFSDFEFAKQSIRLGVFDYLLKPCRPHEIQRVVLSACERLNLRDGADSEIVTPPMPTADAHNMSPGLLVPGARVPTHRTIRRVLEFIDMEYATNITLEAISQRVYVSTAYLSSLFKQEVGINFLEYLHQFRIEKAKPLLRDGTMKNHAIARAVGYFDESHFHRTFKRWTGMSPSQYQREARQDHAFRNTD